MKHCPTCKGGLIKKCLQLAIEIDSKQGGILNIKLFIITDIMVPETQIYLMSLKQIHLNVWEEIIQI